jgi:hypothetical protein
MNHDDRSVFQREVNVEAKVIRVVSVVLQFVSSIAGCLFTLTIAETGKNAVEAVMAILEEVVGGVHADVPQLDYRSVST